LQNNILQKQKNGLQLYPQTANGNPTQIEVSRFVDKAQRKPLMNN
jgi:hypothetical protein